MILFRCTYIETSYDVPSRHQIGDNMPDSLVDLVIIVELERPPTETWCGTGRVIESHCDYVSAEEMVNIPLVSRRSTRLDEGGLRRWLRAPAKGDPPSTGTQLLCEVNRRGDVVAWTPKPTEG